MVVGFTAGIPKIPLNLALLKNCQIMGVFLGAMGARDPAFVANMTREIDELCASGALNRSLEVARVEGRPLQGRWPLSLPSLGAL